MMRLVAIAATLTVLLAAPAAAQLASPSTPALGVGDNFTAAARGYAAAAWNPAGLVMTGAPAWSLALLTPRGIAGFGPVTLGDLSDWQGREVPRSTREQWLGRIRARGGQSGTGGFDATWLAIQVGPVAVQAATSGRAVSDITPGVAELLMFGNADDGGAPQDIDLAGSSLNMNAFSTVAASYALPFVLRDGAARLSVGATLTYTVGHLLVIGRESTGSATADPIAVDMTFPLVHTALGDDNDTFSANGGGGGGIDIGLGYEEGSLSLGVTVRNVVNTFRWDADRLRYRAGTVDFSEQDSFGSDFDSQPLAAAPPALRGLVNDMTFRPAVAAGAMLRQSAGLTLMADARFGGAGGLATGRGTHVGGGAEYRVLAWLPVRAGIAFVQPGEGPAGVQFSGGVGVQLGSYDMSASVARRSAGAGAHNVVMVSLLSLGL
jgi:hypothetical protein